MLIHVPKVLSAEQIAECRSGLEQAAWSDGRQTTGHLSGKVKNNVQTRFDDPVVRRLGDLILSELERHPIFMSAALPHKVVPPLFNRYAGGQSYGPHIDGAIRPVEGTPHRVRTDLSATVFLADPGEYDGGELVVRDTFGVRQVKLPAGDMVLYSASSIHHVEPVTRGARLASFFWIQSMVRDDDARTLLYEFDSTIRELQQQNADHAAIVQLSNLYHNLLRRWADA